ncbi:hypothetical protein CC85DRAFT_285240, partial [Cutaneotrichosporon oleaginosum]
AVPWHARCRFFISALELAGVDGVPPIQVTQVSLGASVNVHVHPPGRYLVPVHLIVCYFKNAEIVRSIAEDNSVEE